MNGSPAYGGTSGPICPANAHKEFDNLKIYFMIEIKGW